MDIADRIFDDLDRFIRAASSARPECVPGLDLMRAHVAGLRTGAAIGRGMERERRYSSPGLDPFVRAARRDPETVPEPEMPTVSEPLADGVSVEPIDPNDVPF